MNARVLLLCLWPGVASAQGFAGLGSAAEAFADPVRGQALSFPADHGAHPEFRIEWWYVTANLTDEDGAPLGLQWTLFRTALAPGGADEAQVWMGHAAVTTAEAHHVEERFSRGAVGTAGASADPPEIWIDEWSMAGDTFEAMRLTASAPDFAYDLDLAAQGPLVLHGDSGFSVKSPEGQASYYYSQPRFAVTGTVTLPDGRQQVTGNAWLDREWSSQPLSETQTGWDWFSLTFDSGEQMMGFVLRDTAGGDFTSGTWIGDGDEIIPFGDGALTATPLETAEVAGRDIPVRWRVELPDHGVDVTVTALNPQAWMDTAFPYWEGPVAIAGSHAGRGYLEMTGYE